jgi:DNA end-binding protein Ku
MALTTTWKGQLKISLVSFPVRLYTAVGSANKLALNQLHKQCRSRIHLDSCCPKHGKLARSEITKGYEYEKGKYITIEQEDLEKIKLQSSRTIEIIQFVNQSELDPVYIDAAYYVAPDGPVTQEGFRIVHKAMRKMKKVGIGQITMHNREYLVALKTYQKGFLLIRLHYADELRNPKACFEDITDGQVHKDQLQLAEQLLKNKTAPFDPLLFKDRYQDLLLEVIKAKIEGVEPSIAVEEERVQVLNLMEALKESVSESVKVPRKVKKPAARTEEMVLKKQRKRA